MKMLKEYEVGYKFKVSKEPKCIYLRLPALSNYAKILKIVRNFVSGIDSLDSIFDKNTYYLSKDEDLKKYRKAEHFKVQQKNGEVVICPTQSEVYGTTFEIGQALSTILRVTDDSRAKRNVFSGIDEKYFEELEHALNKAVIGTGWDQETREKILSKLDEEDYADYMQKIGKEESKVVDKRTSIYNTLSKVTNNSDIIPRKSDYQRADAAYNTASARTKNQGNYEFVREFVRELEKQIERISVPESIERRKKAFFEVASALLEGDDLEEFEVYFAENVL